MGRQEPWKIHDNKKPTYKLHICMGGRTAGRSYSFANLDLLDQVKKLQEDKKEMRLEIERLHGVIQQLTRELDEAEVHAFCMQEKLSQLMKKERL